jgi:tetratricopeptide (TPR) repeat protein/transcriptional regulator with XRE-family HTH domain
MELERPFHASAFGQLLRRHRLNAGLSQEILAERARMSARGIGALERGDRRTPQRDTVTLLADALDLQGDDRDAFAAAANPAGSRRRTLGSVTAGPWPAPPPRPWLVPRALRTQYFTGRDELFARLRGQLKERHRAALSGLGGVGKTQTAIEYAVRYRGDYAGGVFWINAESVGALTSGFLEIAAVLRMPAALSNENDAAVKAVLEWLNSTAGWLLILDNVDDRRDIQPFIPEHGQGDLLITARETVFAELGIPRALHVGDLDPGEATRFLLARTGRDAAAPSDLADAAALSAELGYLPLALEQAAAYVAETNATFSAYLNAFRNRRVAVLEKAAGLIAHDSVAVTWAANFEAVERTSPAAADVLRICALLGSDAIPFELFLEGALMLGDGIAAALADGDDLAMVELLRPLARYSLVHVDTASGVFRIHRLVQETAWAAIAASERVQYFEMAVRALDVASPPVAFAQWDRSERLVTHVTSIANWIATYDVQPEIANGVVNRTASYLRERGRYAEAQALSERALAVGERALGPDHVGIALSLNNLGNAHWDQGRYAQALPLHARALAIRERALGPDHPDVASSLNNLANVHFDQGRYAEALPQHQRALAIREAALDPDHPDIGRILDNIGVTLSNLGRHAEARPLLERALVILESALGSDHPSLANTLNNLADVAHKHDEYAEAAALYQRALVVGQNALGPDHPGVAESLTGLANAYAQFGRRADAEPLYTRALAILERTLGSDHSYLPDTLVGLARLRAHEGRARDAIALYERALAIKERAFGNHPEVAAMRKVIENLRASSPP